MGIRGRVLIGQAEKIETEGEETWFKLACLEGIQEQSEQYHHPMDGNLL
ncbi:hypothetical protein [Heyndrickxia sporothermodurans]|nr:hypothetical protein [Heyndrickxia sporothermodurans]